MTSSIRSANSISGPEMALFLPGRAGKIALATCAVRLPESDEFGSDEKKMEEAYRQMAKDAEHEREAEEWCEALIGDAAE